MNKKLRCVSLFVRFVPIVFLVLLLLIVVVPACSRTPSPETQLANMITAHNRHDVVGELVFFAEDAVFAIPGQTPIVGKAAIRDLFEADSVMNSELIYTDLVVRGDTVIANSVIERNDMLRLLGVPEIHYLPGTRVVFKKGLIQRIEVTRFLQEEWSAMRTDFSNLMAWLQTAHPELLQDIRSGWLSRNTARSAEAWLKLASEWRESEANKGK